MLRRRAILRSPSLPNHRPTHLPFDRLNVNRPGLSIAGWRLFLLLCAGSSECRPSSESEQFGNQGISQAFSSCAQFPVAMSLLGGVAAILVLSRFATQVRLTQAID